jgi:hypothetical protein
MTTVHEPKTRCERPCGALIEQVDSGGYTVWAHVKRMSVDYDHPAVPDRTPGPDPDVRAARTAGLRAFADWIDEHDELPVPYGCAGQIAFDDRTEFEEIAKELGIELTGHPDTYRDADLQLSGELPFGGGVVVRLVGWFKSETPTDAAVS